MDRLDLLVVKGEGSQPDLKSVLAAWRVQDLPCRQHAERENRVYAVGVPARYALRAHRPRLRTKDQIEAELTWMASLADQALPVPRPVPTQDAALVLDHDGQLYSLVTWLPGFPLGQGQVPLTLPDPLQTFRALGRLLARLHALTPPADLDRPRWDAMGLVGETPLWGRFWDHPDLSRSERDLLRAVRDQARQELQALDLPNQLIHADPLQENVLVEGTQVALIDFDDCAYSYLLFDLATALVQRLPDPRFADLRDALIEGYGGCDRQTLALLFVVRCLTYVGWIQDKMTTPLGRAMSQRILARALTQAKAYAEGQSPIYTDGD